jgi:hypothetical protein
MSSEDHQQ